MKDDLRRYLQVGRESLLWKLEGLSEYDVRRPLVASGTNLLGLVKHAAVTEAGYFGAVFGRPFPDPLPGADGDDPTADMWAEADERTEGLVSLYRQVWAHSDATIAALGLDDTGSVPWWPEDRREATLHRILVHVATETHRHAGHADIVREMIDGARGLRRESPNVPEEDEEWWLRHRRRVEDAARLAGSEA
ncbi:MAG: DinB family protein [Acidobacteriota bacterium]|nr:DinB family protein [Acidobacteriota bacterium]